MITDHDRAWMRQAIVLAQQKGADLSDTPIIVLDGHRLAATVNQAAELKDATAHAVWRFWLAVSFSSGLPDPCV